MKEFNKIPPTVSIICPFYNAAETIEQTIGSVINQTYENWEMILVDDGSTDNSRNIVLEQARVVGKDKIRILVSNHSGPARARNVGMDAAHGNYLCFIDADDLYKPEMLSTMFELMTFTGADLSMCSLEKVHNGCAKPIQHGLGQGQLCEHEVIDRFLRLYFETDKRGVASLCNKMFKRSFINQNNLRLNTNMRRAEDWHFILDCLLTNPMPIVAVTDKILYSYIDNVSSITHERPPMSYVQSFMSTQRLMDVNNRFNMGKEINVYSEVMSNSITAIIKLMHMDDKAKCKSCIKEIEQNVQFQQALLHANLLELPLHYKVVTRIWALGGRTISLYVLKAVGCFF